MHKFINYSIASLSWFVMIYTDIYSKLHNSYDMFTKVDQVTSNLTIPSFITDGTLQRTFCVVHQYCCTSVLLSIIVYMHMSN